MAVREKVYAALCALFAVLIVISNMTYQKLVALSILPFYTFELSVGAVVYPLAFLFTDLIAEFYGKDDATFCVRCAVGVSIFASLIVAFMDILPSVSWSKIDDSTFHSVFGFFSVAVAASITACYISQRFDILLYLWIKRVTKGRYLWARSSGSTSVSLFVDTLVVISFFTLFGVIPAEHAVSMVINSYIFKLFFAISSTPIFYLLVSIVNAILNRYRENSSNSGCAA